MEWFQKLWAHPQKNTAEDWHWAQITAKDLYELGQFQNQTKILDLACGQALTTIALSALGCQIEGRDLSQPMLDFAKEHCHEHNVQILLTQQDLRNLADRNTYDVVMLRDVAWGMFDSTTNRELLKNIKLALRPSGKMILEVYNKSVAQQRQPIEGFLHFDPNTGRLSGITSQTTISLEVLTNSEWTDLLQKLGFQTVQIIPALPFRKKGYDAEASLINYIIASLN